MLPLGALAQSNGQPYDPLEGMDANGRIERPELPPDLPNPDRWRYIPEGRIKPGNVFQRLLVTSFPIPLVFIESDVGFGGGVALTDIDFRQQRRREFAGIFLTATTKGQQSYQMAWRRWTAPHGPARRAACSRRSGASYAPGAATARPSRAASSGSARTRRRTTRRATRTRGRRLRWVWSAPCPAPATTWIASGGASFELHNLSSGEVSDVPSTGESFPLIFAQAEDANLGWLDAGLALRHARQPAQCVPRLGGWRKGRRRGAPARRRRTGGRFTLSGTKIFPLPGLFHDGGDPDEENPPTDVLALDRSGPRQPPESCPSSPCRPWAAPTACAATSAGAGADRAAWYAAAEYRFWFLERGFRLTRQVHLERLGAALFYEIGSVANDWPRLFDARVHQSYGVSLRLSLERAAPFRVDFGFSDEGLVVTARFGLSF